MDKALKLSLIAGIAVISFSVAFYFVHFLPTKDRSKQNARSECAMWAKDKAAKDWTRNHEDEGQYDQMLYDDYFERCLREKGI